MRRILTLTLILFISVITKAQDLIQQIPANAKLVAAVKGNKFLELMSIEEFNNSYVGKRILSKISREANKSYKDLQDFGIDVSGSFYYYLLPTDSIMYNCFLVPIKNATKFYQLLADNSGERNIVINNGMYTYIEQYDSATIWQWNERQLLIVKGTESKDFFDRDEVATRYGFEKPHYSWDTDSSVAAVDSVALPPLAEPDYAAVDTAKAAVEEPKPVYKKTTPKKTSTTKKGKAVTKKSSATAKKTKVKKEETEEEEPQYGVDSVKALTESYNEKYEAYCNKKNALINGWAMQYATQAFAKPSVNSIITNPSFVKSIDPIQDASVWLSNEGELISVLMPTYYFKGVNVWSDWKCISANLVMDKQQIKIATSLEASDSSAMAYKRIYEAKLNKKLFNYLNEDRMIGYITCAMNSKNYLEEYPKMMARIYGSKYSDEAKLGADILSLLLDEEAIGKVFKGDGIFVFSGISQKEVSYKTYDYDDNYKSIEIEKKKTETLPDFMFMGSTEDPSILQKLINYGIKKNAVVMENGYFKINIPGSSPMDLYTIIKDGIVFLGTNKPEFDKIAKGSFDAKISKQTKKFMQDGNFSTYFSPKKLAGKIPADEIGDLKKVEKWNNVLSHTGDVYIRAGNVTGNTLLGSMIMEVPAGETNSLKYLFSLIELALEN